MSIFTLCHAYIHLPKCFHCSYFCIVCHPDRSVSIVIDQVIHPFNQTSRVKEKYQGKNCGLASTYKIPRFDCDHRKVKHFNVSLECLTK